MLSPGRQSPVRRWQAAVRSVKDGTRCDPGVLATVAGAVILGLDWRVGAIIGSMAMAGDLFSSFIKRRLGMAPSSMAVGLDQIPESLFPLVACRGWLSLGLVDIVIGVTLFFAGEIVLSRLFFALGLRDRPY